MSDYLSEDEQAEAVKRWFRENALFLIGGLVLGIGGLFGWNQWQSQQKSSAEQASLLFEEMVGHVRALRVGEAEQLVELLQRDHRSSPYVDQARLLAARLHLERNMPEQSVPYLQAVVDGRGPPELRLIARLRLARLLLFQEEADRALEVLSVSDPGVFAARFHQVRGDAQVLRGDAAAARREYELALGADQDGLLDRNFVQAKLDQLRVASPDERVGTEPLPPAGGLQLQAPL
ncbi:MAG: tetratricopeptide repeat protein [Chromatiales bacterium]|nr:tetratricopeptide repeat protein [Chromatiales bacterium]